MSTVSEIKQNLIDILSTIDGVTCAFDYSTAEEAEKAIIIDDFYLKYEHDLDMGYHKELTFTAELVTKTDEDLDELISALENLDNETSGNVRDLMLESVSIEEIDDQNNRYARASMSCYVWD